MKYVCMTVERAGDLAQQFKCLPGKHEVGSSVAGTKQTNIKNQNVEKLECLCTVGEKVRPRRHKSLVVPTKLNSRVTSLAQHVSSGCAKQDPKAMFANALKIEAIQHVLDALRILGRKELAQQFSPNHAPSSLQQ